MSDLTPLEYDILNAVYFVESFDHIVEECNVDQYQVADTLKTMISKKWIVPMVFDKEVNDYRRSIFYDSDNMKDFHFMATREGLEVHNSR